MRNIIVAACFLFISGYCIAQDAVIKHNIGENGEQLRDSIFFQEGGTYSLEEFRSMALQCNRDLQIADQNIKAAEETRKEIFTQFLPSVNLTGGYYRTGRKIRMLDSDKYLPVGYLDADIQSQLGGIPIVPSVDPTSGKQMFAYLPASQMEYDAREIFGGGVSLVQPLYMGGLVREAYKLAKINEKVNILKGEERQQRVILEVDEAYWRVVSLINKQKLGQKYLDLLNKLYKDVCKMKDQGIATKGDVLNVKVKQNEASLMLTKIENGLSLSKMALYQLCGLKISGNYLLRDENIEQETVTPVAFDKERVFAMRPELQMLEQANLAAQANVKMSLARFLPKVALTGSYLMSNPNVYNGFSRHLKDNWVVGVMLTIPITHFGERIHNYRAAQFKEKVSQLDLLKAKEMVELQLNQSSFKVTEANKKLTSAISNMEAAQENLRLARESYAEGLISLTDLMAAQTAWLSASSEKIDSGVEVRLTTLYLEKAKGELGAGGEE